ncbi:MAG TPA: hypothetical protein VGQ41_13695 [Pyrinomonadaceae bacterium]|jgi:hypothetical protein|nr:hypothetical protein [Pyrinomonadaceae bacterium]
MTDNESFNKKDQWDRADVIGKLLIPIMIAAATLWFDYSRRVGEAQQKTFEIAIEILRSPQSSETEQLRSWALQVLQKETGAASSQLPQKAIQELQQGTLPGTSELRLQNSGQLRVAIIRLEGTPNDPSEKIKSALADAGYTNVTTSERAQDVFPSNAEVRFYYPADSVNAQSLSDYISRNLGIPMQIKDRSQDRDASSHRLGDLHVYIR